MGDMPMERGAGLLGPPFVVHRSFVELRAFTLGPGRADKDLRSPMLKRVTTVIAADDGFALPFVLFMLAAAAVALIALFSSINNQRQANGDLASREAPAAVEAGVTQALVRHRPSD
jgi:hypothetical protein